MIIVLILSFTLVPISNNLLLKFLIGVIFIIFGLTLFLIGVDLGITPLGKVFGLVTTKKNKLWIVIISVSILGFFISFAEPGLMVFANQIDLITSGAISSNSILISVSIGIGIMLVIGFVRVLYNLSLVVILNVCYFIVLILALFTSKEFLAIAFDASGTTTGILAVPFILSLSLGITSRKKNSIESEKDSFGLVAIASVGAIVAVMILNHLYRAKEFKGHLETGLEDSLSIVASLLKIIPIVIWDSIIAFFPLVIIFVIISIISVELNKRMIRRISFGLIYSFIGMIIFFIGINLGFMEVGAVIGSSLTIHYASYVIIAVGFILGLVTILAEPAVYVLTKQIEDVTAGYVKKKSVLVSLSIGVGLAVALSMLRIIVPGIELWHYILPGYIAALILSFICPKLFVGIAFDAGGVATGPMTATFILAFTSGAANANSNADILKDGFGMITMVALMPIITLQILGLIFKIKTKKERTDS